MSNSDDAPVKFVMRLSGTTVYLVDPGPVGGFDVRNCPEPLVLAATIVRACNEYDALKAENELIKAALRDLSRAYTTLIASGRERIIALGGDCDPVDVMERGDPYLRNARLALNSAGGK